MVVIIVPVFIWQSYQLMGSYRSLNEQVTEFADQFGAIAKLSEDAIEASDTALSAMDNVLDNIERLQRMVDDLTIKETSNRLAEIDKTIERLSNKLDAFEQIIDPETAQDILTIARLSEEIVARTKFESKM